VDWLIPMQSLTISNPTLIAALIIGFVVGIIIGWLLTYLPARRGRKALLEQNARLEASMKNNKLDGEEARGQIDLLRGELRSVTASQAELRNQLLVAQEAKGELDRTLQQRDVAIDELKREIVLAQDKLEQVESRSHATLLALSADAEATKASLEAAGADNERLAGALSHAQAELANARQALFDRPDEMEALRAAADQATQAILDKQTALDEAYGRAAGLLLTVEERNTRVASLEAQLAVLQGELDTTLAQRRALEAHLLSVRGNVAGEMVRVTQALIKVKEDQLSEANERCEALLMELTALKGKEEKETIDG
jgi:chromosome segregation ATPase